MARNKYFNPLKPITVKRNYLGGMITSEEDCELIGYSAASDTTYVSSKDDEIVGINGDYTEQAEIELDMALFNRQKNK